ncbi:ParA family protein [Kutzneria sp. NPDC052558]|uniref:ParA family protein n=1 Tax=Kutzneria sp. NPDC052558 TaxID=3364121 RepID=UPI0037C65309
MREIAEGALSEGFDLTVVRDMVGRITVIIDDRALPVDEAVMAEISSKIRTVTGSYCSMSPVVRASELIDPAAIVESADALVVQSTGERRGRLSLLERGIVGADWTRLSGDQSQTRITLYGFKGGVGRSTATFMLANHLAASGKCVLVIDLDLESPGVGSLLQSMKDLPEYGLVDYLVESAVGNADGLDLVVRSQNVEAAGNGEVWLAPAGGRPRRGYDYLAKLNRIYFDLPVENDEGRAIGFAGRLVAAVEACETEVMRRSRRPDIVLLDSRAGIHDVAAVAITQLSHLSLLFAANTEATWTGYKTLFSQWGSNSAWATEIRLRLKMVASMVPGLRQEKYLADFRDRAQVCFSETLYEDATGVDPDAYNPGPEDLTAPHAPLPILFTNDLVGLDTSRSQDWRMSEFVVAAFGDFLDGVTSLIPDAGKFPGEHLDG